MDIFNRLREKFEERKALWTEEQCQDRVSAQKHINTWNVALSIVDMIEKEYCEHIKSYTGKGTFTEREIRLLELEAFEKQMVAIKTYNEDGLYHCPKCKMPILSSTNHCSDCGQKLDWN